MRIHREKFPIATIWAAIWLPFLFGTSMFIHAQTMGLPAPVSGDCSSSSAGVMTCTKMNNIPFAASATTDATNAGNLSSGTIPAERLANGAAGTMASYGANGMLQPAMSSPYVASAGPIKVAPYNVSAQSSAGAATLGPSAGDTDFVTLNVTNSARMLTSGNITQVTTFVNSTTSATALYYETWRVNPSGTFSLVGRSENLLSATTAGATNTYTLATPIAVQAGDYSAMHVVGNFGSAVNTFSASTTYATSAYPSYNLRNVGLTSTLDFTGNATSNAAGAIGNENPIEVYLDRGPIVACMGDSKMQGIPFSDNYLQAAGNSGAFVFPVANERTDFSTLGVPRMIDPSNQPCAYVERTLGYTTANLGITGSTSTQQMTYALPTALALKPAVVVISGTINDGSLSVPPATSVANYQSMYNQLIAAGIQKVVLTGVEPASIPTDAVWTNEETVNANMKSFCQAQTKCVWVGDRVSQTLGQYRPSGPAGNYRNIQPAYAAVDNLHFNNAGAQMMGVIEAEGIEPPSTIGSTVAVPQPTGGTRVRTAQALSADGTTGWKWQDTRDYLQMEPQMANNSPLAWGTNLPGQQSIGCVVFSFGRGYVRCDGQMKWSMQTGVLTVPSITATAVTAGTITANQPFIVTNNAANPSFLGQFVAPALAANTVVCEGAGKAMTSGNSDFLCFWNTAYPYGSIEPYAGSIPQQIKGAQVWLNGGNVYVGNVNTTGAVNPSTLGGGLFNVGSSNQFQVSAGGIPTAPLTTPASASATCTAGQFENDANYMYVCTATNTWKRVALSAF